MLFKPPKEIYLTISVDETHRHMRTMMVVIHYLHTEKSLFKVKIDWNLYQIQNVESHLDQSYITCKILKMILLKRLIIVGILKGIGPRLYYVLKIVGKRSRFDVESVNLNSLSVTVICLLNAPLFLCIWCLRKLSNFFDVSVLKMTPHQRNIFTWQVGHRSVHMFATCPLNETALDRNYSLDLRSIRNPWWRGSRKCWSSRRVGSPSPTVYCHGDALWCPSQPCPARSNSAGWGLESWMAISPGASARGWL